MNFDQGGDVSHEKDKDAANGKPGVQKQPSGNEGALAREAVNTSKPAAESVVSNSN
jgi:YTH domain-containing family protein